MRPALLALCLTLVLTLAASSALAAPAAKPVAKPPAAPSTATEPKAASPKPTATTAAKPTKAKAGPFNASNPADIIARLSTMGAKATQARSEDGMVFLDVTAPGTSFGVQMIGCDPKGTACHAMALFTVFDKAGITLAQLNDFNRSQFACRGLLTPDGHPSVMYAALVDGRINQDQTKAHLGVWQGCLKGFGDFVADPVEFLSKPHG